LASDNEFFKQRYGELYPTPFDEFMIKEAKLITLAACFKTIEPPQDVLNVLVCMNDFWYYNRISDVNKRLNMIFTFLRRIIKRIPTQDVFSYLVNLLHHEQSLPQHFVMNKFTRLITRLKEDDEHEIAKELLLAMYHVICQVQDDDANSLIYYFPFIETIICDELIDPNVSVVILFLISSRDY
jgi:hypothetical protein